MRRSSVPCSSSIRFWYRVAFAIGCRHPTSEDGGCLHPSVHGSRFTVHGSRFTVHGSRFTVHGSWFMVHGSWCVVRHGMCFGLSMAIARHHEQLDCWRLSEELRLGVEAILAKPLVSRDFGFCDQIRDSTSSAPANIAEGFAR